MIDIKNKPPHSDLNSDFIFISYSHKDAEIVYEDLWNLHENNVNYWYDYGLPAGKKWDEMVEKVINSPYCKGIIFYLSSNAITSESLESEFRLVFNNNHKNFFAVHIGGESIMAMISKAYLTNNTITTERINLFTSIFSDKSLRFDRESAIKSTSHIMNVLYELKKYGVVNQEEDKFIQTRNTSKKVLMICEKSGFSNSLLSGINDYLSNVPNIIFEKKLFEKTTSTDHGNLNYYEILDSERDNYDAFIIRPFQNITENLFELLKIISVKKKIILLDLNLTEEQQKKFGPNLPIFIASDFIRGGEILGNKIRKYYYQLGKNDTKIVLFEGPYYRQSIKERCESIKNVLNEITDGKNFILERFISIQDKEAISKISERCQIWLANKTLYKKNCILFTGNDSVAREVLKAINSKDPNNAIYCVFKDVKKLIIVGYDGIKDINGDPILKSFPVDFLTIDTIPIMQGRFAAEALNTILFDNKKIENIYVEPLLIENVNLCIPKSNNINDFKYLLEYKKLFLFDFDGTIADTEKIHWEAYNVMLKNYNVQLKEDDIIRYIGNTEILIYQMIKKDFNIDFDSEYFFKNRIEIYMDLIEKNNLLPYNYFYNIIKKYPNIPFALVTSQAPEVIDKLLSLWDLKKFFPKERIFSVYNGLISKKEIYANINDFITIGNERIKNDEIIVFEDSESVISHAKKLNIDCIGIEHNYNKCRIKSSDAILSDNYKLGLFVGLFTQDIVYYIDDTLPEENQKVRTNDFKTFIGGPATNAALTYSLLGGQAILVTYIGDSKLGISLKKELETYGIIVIDIAHNSHIEPNISSIIVNKSNGNRTIFSGQRVIDFQIDINLSDLNMDFNFCLYDCNLPFFEDYLVDFISQQNIPYILDAGSYKKGNEKSLAIATEIIASSQYFEPQVGNIFDIAKKYCTYQVAMTKGPHPIEYLDNGNIGHIHPPKLNNIIDTLGAGDVFHGAYCYYRYNERNRFADALSNASKIASESTTEKGPLTALKKKCKFIACEEEK